MESKPMYKLNNKKPTEPGHYWYLENGDLRIVKVEFNTLNTKLGIFVGGLCHIPVENYYGRFGFPKITEPSGLKGRL